MGQPNSASEQLLEICDRCVKARIEFLGLRATCVRIREAVDMAIEACLAIRACDMILLSTVDRPYRFGRKIRLFDLKKQPLKFWLSRLKCVRVIGAVSNSTAAHLLCGLF